MSTRIAVAALLLLCAACGGSNPASPTPTTPTTGSGNAPAVRIEVKADESGSRDAIVLLSEVVADASGSAGSGPLTFSIDFGDGFVATSATARHAYSAPGTFTITATVTDAQSRKVSESRQIAVTSLTGSWFQAEYVQRTRRVEVRRLTVTSQDGLTIRGTYQVTSAANRTFTGTLTAPRSVRMTVDGGASLDGVLPSPLNDEAENWILQARGDTVDGERLEFRPILGDPAAPPDADFIVRFGEDDLRRPIAAISPIQVDDSYRSSDHRRGVSGSARGDFVRQQRPAPDERHASRRRREWKRANLSLQKRVLTRAGANRCRCWQCGDISPSSLTKKKP